MRPPATLIWFGPSAKQFTRVWPLRMLQLHGATDESWVPGGNQKWVNGPTRKALPTEDTSYTPFTLYIIQSDILHTYYKMQIT